MSDYVNGVNQSRLETTIRNTTWGLTYPHLQQIAEAIIADGWEHPTPPTFTTPEEIDQLPIGSVLRDVATGTVYLRIGRYTYGWQTVAQERRLNIDDIIERSPTVSLLFAPASE